MVDLDPDRIKEASGSGWLRRVLVFRETDSTNELLLRMAEGGEPEGTALLADRQLAGRGQFGRKWESSAAVGIWLSLLLRPSDPARTFEGLSLRFAGAVGRVVEEVTKMPVTIKPPNDVLLDGRKVCGILVEARISARGNFAVVGVGLNVNQCVEDFAPALRSSAVSMRQVGGDAFDRSCVAGRVLRELADSYQEWLRPGAHEGTPTTG